MLIRKGNVELEVSEELKDEYLEKGYDVIDEKGNIIIKAIPVDMGELRKAYKEHLVIINELKNEIAELKKVNVVEPVAKKEPKKATKK